MPVICMWTESVWPKVLGTACVLVAFTLNNSQEYLHSVASDRQREDESIVYLVSLCEQGCRAWEI